LQFKDLGREKQACTVTFAIGPATGGLKNQPLIGTGGMKKEKGKKRGGKGPPVAEWLRASGAVSRRQAATHQ